MVREFSQFPARQYCTVEGVGHGNCQVGAGATIAIGNTIVKRARETRMVVVLVPRFVHILGQ